jgi:hypothetical protein
MPHWAAPSVRARATNRGPLRSIPWARRQVREITDPATMDRRLETVRESLVAVLGRLREKAPDAQIVLVDYLTIVPSDAAIPIPGLPGSTAAWARDAAERLNAMMSTVALSEGCAFLAVGQHPPTTTRGRLNPERSVFGCC